MITIEEFTPGIENELWEVFFTAIRNVCCKHYEPHQVEAWAPNNFDPIIWKNRMEGIRPLIAKIESKVVGYSDLQKNGYIDHFFVHGNFQSKGVGSALMECHLKNGVQLDKLFSHVSITARPFFEHYGFKVIKSQEVIIRGVSLNNFEMARSKIKKLGAE
jgi:putative acetyltransferase